MIEKNIFNSWKQWKTVLILWAVHWNEHWWTVAINKIIQQIQDWTLKIQSGKIIFVPVANPDAYQLHQRHIEQNLNRVFKKRDKTKTYEQKVANKLTELVEDSDFILDLHSFQWQWNSFVCDDFPSDITKKIFEKLPFEYIIQNWQSLETAKNTWDSMKYMNFVWKQWLLIEWWNHSDVSTIENLYLSIIVVLQTLWVLQNINIEEETSKKDFFINRKIISAKESFIKNKEWQFLQPRREFKSFSKWESICSYDDWTFLQVKYDCYLLIPKHNAKKWEERFYLWV